MTVIILALAQSAFWTVGRRERRKFLWYHLSAVLHRWHQRFVSTSRLHTWRLSVSPARKRLFFFLQGCKGDVWQLRHSSANMYQVKWAAIFCNWCRRRVPLKSVSCARSQTPSSTFTKTGSSQHLQVRAITQPSQIFKLREPDYYSSVALSIQMMNFK